jgi:hypothetical protein
VSAAALAGACDRPPPAGGPPPSSDQRLQTWADAPDGTAVPVALGFRSTLPDSTVAALLDRHGLRPYAVYLTAAGLTTSQRRDQSRASLEVIAEAREQTISQLRTSMCAQQGRARGMLSEPPQGDPSQQYRDVLGRFLEIQKTLPELERGRPMIYGVEAVGALADVKAASTDPDVAIFEPGWRGRTAAGDSIVVPQPPAPPDSAASPPPELRQLQPDEIKTRMSQLADNGLGSCAGETGP